MHVSPDTCTIMEDYHEDSHEDPIPNQTSTPTHNELGQILEFIHDMDSKLTTNDHRLSWSIHEAHECMS